MNNPNHPLINETALKLILLFYRAQIESMPKVRNFLINFRDVLFIGFEIEEYGNKDPFYTAITRCSNNASVLYSAFEYLKDKHMLEFSSKKTLDRTITLYNFRLTAEGFDAIESGNDKKGGRPKLIENFNLNLNFKLDLESIFKIDLLNFTNLI